MEVTLPRCRYRADVAGYRSVPRQIGSTGCSNVNRRCAICDETTVKASPRGDASKGCAIVASFSKRGSARIIQTCTMVIRFSGV